MTFGPTTPFAHLSADAKALAVLEHHLPGVTRVEDARLQPFTTLEDLAQRVRAVGSDLPDLAPLWAELAGLAHPTRHEPSAPPSCDDRPTAQPGTTRTLAVAAVERWGVAELVLDGPRDGNPFVDVELAATFTCGDRNVRVGGFYDGNGSYSVRFMPPTEGTWTFATASSAPAMDGVTGSFDVGPATLGNHGPVRVRGQYHFGYEDQTPYLPFGTTSYAWTHQPPTLQERTLSTLARTSFTKLRMCVFPKSFIYNAEDPQLFPFERANDGSWDLTRLSLEYFRNLEHRIGQLQDLGIEADLILFHPYDRWGFSQMPRWADLLFARYVVRRLAAFRNVWWSLANEYDFMRGKTLEDWEAIADVVIAEDHVGHLTSIHNGAVMFDHSRSWITHCSIQQNTTDQTSTNVDRWREFGKPVVVDETGYEGDLPWGWGNLTAREMVRRAWEGAVRGGYVNHGETFANEVIWWSHGGALHGESPERFAFLSRIVAETSSGWFEPLPSDFDFPCGGDDDHRILYFGSAQPASRPIVLPPGTWDIDLIDTWEMTVTSLASGVVGQALVDLPERTDLAVRVRRRA